MRRTTWTMLLTLMGAATCGPALAEPVTGLAPLMITAAIEHAVANADRRAIDPQAGSATWGGDLKQFLDRASGYSWRAPGSAVQLGYQQREFAPHTPGFDTRGYETLLKDAPDMMGFSVTLRTR
jgi:hypothetical protein